MSRFVLIFIILGFAFPSFAQKERKKHRAKASKTRTIQRRVVATCKEDRQERRAEEHNDAFRKSREVYKNGAKAENCRRRKEKTKEDQFKGTNATK